MSKKKFSAGLDNIFEAKEHDHHVSIEMTIDETEEQREHIDQQHHGLVKRNKVSLVKHGKSFTSDLDTLLEEALVDSIEEKLDFNSNRGERLSSQLNIPKKAVTISGLDALIRRTVENVGNDFHRGTSKQTRVTFTFEKSLVSKLKVIARNEKSYLKDIINQIVEGYISSYESKKGTLPDVME
ncbi:MAG: hypothetical protein KBA06_03090 [Saprospiraceae bacterium]|nr:hypothetical protein [Saprospiraceae bacterium]